MNIEDVNYYAELESTDPLVQKLTELSKAYLDLVQIAAKYKMASQDRPDLDREMVQNFLRQCFAPKDKFGGAADQVIKILRKFVKS